MIIMMIVMMIKTRISSYLISGAKSRGAAVILGESFCFAKAICFKKEEDDEGSGVEMTLTYLMLIV